MIFYFLCASVGHGGAQVQAQAQAQVIVRFMVPSARALVMFMRKFSAISHNISNFSRLAFFWANELTWFQVNDIS